MVFRYCSLSELLWEAIDRIGEGDIYIEIDRPRKRGPKLLCAIDGSAANHSTSD